MNKFIVLFLLYVATLPFVMLATYLVTYHLSQFFFKRAGYLKRLPIIRHIRHRFYVIHLKILHDQFSREIGWCPPVSDADIEFLDAVWRGKR